MSQEELQLKPVIDTYEKLISAICDKLRESWMTTEDKQHIIAEEIVHLLKLIDCVFSDLNKEDKEK